MYIIITEFGKQQKKQKSFITIFWFSLLPYQNDPGQRRIAAQTPGRVCDMITSP